MMEMVKSKGGPRAAANFEENVRDESVMVQNLRVNTRKQIRTEDFVVTYPVLKT